MLSNVSAFSKTSAGILLALLIPAILLLTGCPSPTSSQDQTTYYIKCTITDGGGTATHYEFYKGFIVSNDPARQHNWKTAQYQPVPW